MKKPPEGIKIIATNPKAGRLYNLLEVYEAGLELHGAEVKSLRNGKANMGDAFARVDKGEMFLYNLHISQYAFDWRCDYDPTRKRKMLLHKGEIERLAGRMTRGGLALVATKLYFKHGLAKVEIALGKAKKLWDRRDDMKRKEMDREIRRAGARPV